MVYHCAMMKGTKNDWELTLHHFATVFSLIFCYFTNFEHFGTFILISSDVSDAFLNLCKFYRDITGKKGMFTDVLFFSLMVLWFFSRNVFLLGCFATGTFKFQLWRTFTPGIVKYVPLWEGVKFGAKFIVVNIFIICFLNIYWFCLGVKSIIIRLTSKNGEYQLAAEGDKYKTPIDGEKANAKSNGEKVKSE